MYSVKFGDFIVIFIKLVYYFSEQIKSIFVSFFRFLIGLNAIRTVLIQISFRWKFVFCNHIFANAT